MLKLISTHTKSLDAYLSNTLSLKVASSESMSTSSSLFNFRFFFLLVLEGSLAVLFLLFLVSSSPSSLFQFMLLDMSYIIMEN